MEPNERKFLGDSNNTRKLLAVYQMIHDSSEPDALLTNVLLGYHSYGYARKTARSIADVNGRGRSVYSEDVFRLMQFPVDEGIDPNIERSTIDLLTSAINTYLADKQELPADSNTRRTNIENLVKVLMIELISQGLINILNELKIPEYVKPMVDTAMDTINKKAQEVFSNWLDDCIELGNDNLVDYISDIGPDFFGMPTSTKAKDGYNAYLQQFLSTIKNPGEMYSRYLTRRKEYDKYTKRIQQHDLYEIFQISPNSFNKVQRILINDFTLRYNDDVNSQFIMRVINGIE